jgi:hypothetical protein
VKRRLLKWLLAWGVLGLATPLLFILHWKLTSSAFGEWEGILWPSSIFLMALEGTRSNLDILEVYAIVIAENVALYLLVGLLTGPIVFMVLRWRNRTSAD